MVLYGTGQNLDRFIRAALRGFFEIEFDSKNRCTVCTILYGTGQNLDRFIRAAIRGFFEIVFDSKNRCTLCTIYKDVGFGRLSNQ